MESDAAFAEKIEDMSRKMRGHRISGKAFCTRAGISESTWCRWKSGASKPQMRKWIDAKAALKALILAAKRGQME